MQDNLPNPFFKMVMGHRKIGGGNDAEDICCFSSMDDHRLPFWLPVKGCGL